MIFKKLTALLIICLTINEISCVCPKPDVIVPCTCWQNWNIQMPNRQDLYCGGNEKIDLENIFSNLSQKGRESEKHFNSFKLNNTAITQLKGNTFKDITFDQIYVLECKSLAKINKNAFNGTDKVSTSIAIDGSPSLSSKDIFEVLSEFNSLETISIASDMTEVTSNITRSFVGNPNKLKDLGLSGQQIRKLEPNSFSSFINLRSIALLKTEIDYIPDNAFAFENPSNRSLFIVIAYNLNISGSSFSTNSLANINRNTTLAIASEGRLTYFNEKVFLPFLQDEKNKLEFVEKSLDCNDCRNHWLTKYPQFRPRIKFLQCSNNKQFNDPDNFKNC